MAHLELWTGSSPSMIPLDADRVTAGTDEGNRISLEDRTASRLHAVLERVGPGWSIRDLGSSNGTFVNGKRILNEKALRHGDEITVGRTRMVFRADAPSAPLKTESLGDAPDLTRRELDVLEALCAPVAHGDIFSGPATIKDIARALFVTEAAVKQHLSNLYRKFDVDEDGPDKRRGRLANEAIRRGVVSLADLRSRSRT